MAGDGCLSRGLKNRTISITCNYYNDRPFFDEVVIPLLNKIRGKKTKYRLRPKYGKIEINFSDKELFNKLVSIGFPVGKKWSKLEIPDIFQSNKYTKNIIAGFFATDGSVVRANNHGILYPRLEIHNKCHKILEQMQSFLLTNNIKANIYKIKPRNGFSISRLDMNGKINLLKFESLIGFINPKHKSLFEGFRDGRVAQPG